MGGGAAGGAAVCFRGQSELPAEIVPINLNLKTGCLRIRPFVRRHGLSGRVPSA